MALQNTGINNPNQPFMPVLASAVPPPPLWPLPVADWVILPVAGIVTMPGQPQPPVSPALTGAITAAAVTTGGTGYTWANVIVNSPTGSGAQVTATVSGGAVTALTLVNGGSNYSVPPDTITIVGDGSGATGTITGTPLVPPAP